MNDSLGDRMKSNYEDRYRIKLVRRTPVILRLDGKSFHTLTKLHCDKGFDEKFNLSMVETSSKLVNNIQGAKCAYTQSDEISLLLTDFDKLTTDAWFDYNLQKIVSISAAMASVTFSNSFGTTGLFDCRAFNIPKEEACNYFIWRQKDWIRNSVQMLAQLNFSAKQLHKKSLSDIHEMLHSIGINWADLEDKWKNGIFIYKDKKDEDELTICSDAIFQKHRPAIEKYLAFV
jgi:tRNA(His) guanylyltransferase